MLSHGNLFLVLRHRKDQLTEIYVKTDIASKVKLDIKIKLLGYNIYHKVKNYEVKQSLLYAGKYNFTLEDSSIICTFSMESMEKLNPDFYFHINFVMTYKLVE